MWDKNKGIAHIAYSPQGYPLRVQFRKGHTTEYVYTPDGQRLRTIHRTAVPNITIAMGDTLSMNSTNTLSTDTTEYLGGFVFENGQLDKYRFDGGYCTFTSATGQPAFHYFSRDHQGNNRAVVNHDGTIEQAVHYYPLGGIFADAGTNGGLQKYKYNGKELDRMHGLNFYDYGARQYGPILGRFTQIDPLCEKYYNFHPYAYCLNNPVNAVDFEGNSTWVVNAGLGLYRIVGGNLADNDRSIYVGYTSGNLFTPLYLLGITTSTTSFYNSDPKGGGWQKGSIINTNDDSGDKFLSSIISNNPPMFDDYIMNARNGHPYDFKVTNGTNSIIKGVDSYRGMPIGETKDGRTIFSSARDIGNIAAGYVAAVNGMSWKDSRMAFDLYQFHTDNTFEGKSTKNAEYYGWLMGYNNTTPAKKGYNFYESVKSLFGSIWNSCFK